MVVVVSVVDEEMVAEVTVVGEMAVVVSILVVGE